jgi:hypothetical protein
VSSEEREQLAQLIYSYLVRRTLCNLTTKNLNKVFQSIAAEFLTNGTSVASFKEYFSKKAGASSRFPRRGRSAWHLERKCVLNFSTPSAYRYSLGT